MSARCVCVNKCRPNYTFVFALMCLLPQCILHMLICLSAMHFEWHSNAVKQRKCIKVLHSNALPCATVCYIKKEIVQFPVCCDVLSVHLNESAVSMQPNRLPMCELASISTYIKHWHLDEVNLLIKTSPYWPLQHCGGNSFSSLSRGSTPPPPCFMWQEVLSKPASLLL